ncbi:MAG TPA: low molecular weight protein-tyrosine-phosphatase [Arenimonas sp.]|nr:low molecular weight protein-tyrosine-phosphatase [Arenimonas sp.]
MKILFVCMGNICRSPMLEGVFRQRLAAHPHAAEWSIDSAGTGGWHAGRAPDPRAIACLAARGIDISGLRARVVTERDFHAFDLLLCADRDNLAELRRRRPADATAELALALEWAGITARSEVPDPYYGDRRDFETVADLAGSLADAMLARLLGRA